MTKLEQLAELGQSIWLDYIRRSFTASGELQALIDQGLRGITSNPTIFEKAIAGSADYDEDFRERAQTGAGLEDVYTSLVVEDIRQAADLLRPVYDRTQGSDGFVSLEVNPTLANDTQGTLDEARRLWGLVDRPNLMIKIPATREGIPAITDAIADGINVNVTLIFSLMRYADVMAAYIKGLQLRHQAGEPLDRLASVASFFISRVDSKVDERLEAVMKDAAGPTVELAKSLRGQAAVANARLAYNQFEAVFIHSETFATLRAAGAQLQRPLWASTSTKNPDYSDIKYVQELIAPHTINTLPQATIDAFVDHGEVRASLKDDYVRTARFVFESLADLGISMEEVTHELEVEGVASFAKSFTSLMDTLADKRSEYQPGWQPLPGRIGSLPLKAEIGPVLGQMEKDRILARLWEKDHTVWKPDPAEISNRLGWLNAWENVDFDEIRSFEEGIRTGGYTQVVLLGMGGSSLAPELFSTVFGDSEHSLPVFIGDTTDPGYIRDLTARLDPEHTLFIVSTKSGGTEETLSLFRHFYNWTSAAVENPGQAFVAITDPKSKLVDLAERFSFRHVFLNDPNIGGRYSALSYFGLVPAALAGVDISRLAERAAEMARRCGPQVRPQDNPAAILGALLAEGAQNGRDKLTFVLSPEIQSFGDWVEQLIAESTGKEGEGILPVVGEPLGAPDHYDDDRYFVHIALPGDQSALPALAALEAAGFPVLRLHLRDRYDLGGQFLLWELATAIASYRMGINPFDQPNVEAAKVSARQVVQSYKETGNLSAGEPDLQAEGISVFGAQPGEGVHLGPPATPGEALVAFLSHATPGDYIALQAFLTPEPETSQALAELRSRLMAEYRLATTVGYGPRFLHSTGQLHKGDAGNGLFIQFTSDDQDHDIPVPDEGGAEGSSMSFGVLKLAQALGDRQALLDAGRRVLRLHLQGDAAPAIRRLAEVIAG